MSELELRLGGQGIDARALRDALDATLKLLRNNEEPSTWRIADLRLSSAVCTVEPDSEYDIGRLGRGLADIRKGLMPAEWSLSNLKAARTLGRLPGRYNVTATTLTPHSAGEPLVFTAELADRIDAILSPAAATTWSLIAGKVVEWKTEGSLKVETPQGKISVEYDETLRPDALGAIDKYAELWGRVTKNVDGEVKLMFLRGMEVVPPPTTSTIDEFVGSLRGVEGFPQTVDEWLSEVRYGD